jgi:hypothetical protein
MMRREQALEFAKRFVDQWLRVRQLDTDKAPDAKLFPAWSTDEEMRSDIRLQPAIFFQEILKRDLSILNLIDSSQTILTRKLARHLGETVKFTNDAQQPQWTDANAEFGKQYTYQVQTIVKLGDNKQAESDLSAEAAITPADTFPPAVPSGLRPSAAVNSIELAWDRNNESDLAGYRLYRATVTAAAAAPLEKLADIGQNPSYSDRNVEHGKTYRYALSAIDRVGNESPKTPIVEAALP